jgi:oxalate decarboxylase/phosphoglucose isomerase-like protein (cupin superfamily)
MSFQGDLLNGWPEDGEPDMSTLYKVNINNIGGELIKENAQYTLRDNKRLNNLVLSSTKLNANQRTNGHDHDGQEEVYIFTKGKGEMVIKEKNREECRFPVQEGDIVLIPDGAFHQVINSSHLGLFFVCIFDGVRYE